jgi:hypothetical protein
MHWAHILYLFGVEERLIPRTGAKMRTMADYIFANAGIPNNCRPEVATAVIGAYAAVNPAFADTLLGGIAWLMSEEEGRQLIADTQWEGTDLATMAADWHAGVTDEVKAAAEEDKKPNKAERWAEKAKDGNPHLSALAEYAKLASEQSDVPTDFSGHDESIDGDKFGAAARV